MDSVALRPAMFSFFVRNDACVHNTDLRLSLWHVHRLHDWWIPRQAMTWSPKMAKEDLENLGSPGAMQWDDLQNIEMIWTDYGEIADEWAMWKSCVTQCVPRTCWWTEVKGKVTSFLDSLDSLRYVLCRGWAGSPKTEGTERLWTSGLGFLWARWPSCY